MMRSLRPLASFLALAALWPAVASAQSCSVTFDPVTVSQPYNPISANDYVVSFTATARRGGIALNAEYGAVLLRRSGDSRPYQLYVLSDDGGAGGIDIIQTPPGPVLQEGLDDAGEIDLNFGASSGQTIARTFELQLRIPAGSDLPPGNVQAQFDVKYLCDYPFFASSRGTSSLAFTLNFSVGSALQASLVGTEPDFGEIGSLSTSDVAVAPLTTTQRRHFMRVASSGPYEVRVQSQNGWRMTATGAPSSIPGEQIAYRYEVLGQTLDSTRQTFNPVRCRSSGLGGQNIPLTATLTEGGQGKTVSSNYRDTITITVTPLAVSTSGTVNCP